jgi:hypothetical protein
MDKPRRAAAVEPSASSPQGLPGEVPNQQLTEAIAGMARNPASIGPFTGDFSDPPTQSEMRAFRDWANSFFGATARRRLEQPRHARKDTKRKMTDSGFRVFRGKLTRRENEDGTE